MIDALHNYDGKSVAVIGGSSGIGNAIARMFQVRGATVSVTGTRADASDYSAADGSGLTGLHYTQLDVSNDDAIADYRQRFSALDVLVLSHGMVLYGRKEFEMENFRKVIDVNLNSLMCAAQNFYDLLSQSRGSLIIVSSTAAFHATVGNPAYNASKAGAAGLTRTLGKAWAPDGIRVNGIAPGFVETKMTAVTTGNEKRREAAVASIPVGRIGVPDDMAGLALFLASPMAAYIVGQTIVADGGMLL